MYEKIKKRQKQCVCLVKAASYLPCYSNNNILTRTKLCSEKHNCQGYWHSCAKYREWQQGISHLLRARHARCHLRWWFPAVTSDNMRGSSRWCSPARAESICAHQSRPMFAWTLERRSCERSSESVSIPLYLRVISHVPPLLIFWQARQQNLLEPHVDIYSCVTSKPSQYY